MSNVRFAVAAKFELFKVVGRNVDVVNLLNLDLTCSRVIRIQLKVGQLLVMKTDNN